MLSPLRIGGDLMKLLRRLLVALVVLLGLLAVVVAWLRTQAPGMDAYRAHHYESAPQPGALTATWYGVSAVLLRDEDQASRALVQGYWKGRG